jgi:hypothetical protein
MSDATDGGSEEYIKREKELLCCPDNAPILFKNRVYRILKKFNHAWYLHEYYESKYYCNDRNACVYYNRALISIDLSGGRYSNNYHFERAYSHAESICYPNFIMEYELLKEEDVPQKIIECIRRIQESKLVAEVPMDRIEAHERQHTCVIETRINEYVRYFMKYLFIHLEKTDKPLDIVETSFRFDEDDLTRYGCKILYEFVNADGVRREAFADYLDYLLKQMYETDDVSMGGVSRMEAHLNRRLLEEYPMLAIEVSNSIVKIDITNHELLR